MSKEKLDLNKIDLLGLLSHIADEQKGKLAIELLELARSGDPAALRLLEKAMSEAKPKDEKNRPIPILGGITQNPNALQSDNSPVSNTGAEKAA